MKQGKAGVVFFVVVVLFSCKTQIVNILGGSLTAAVRMQRQDHADERGSVPVALSAPTFELHIVFMCHKRFLRLFFNH